MAKNEMTRAQALAILISVANATFLERDGDPELDEAIKVCAHMHDQLIKPKAKTTTVSPARRENEATVRALYETVSTTPFTGSYVMEHTTAMTPQKVVGIMNVGIELGLFEKFKDGKQTLYQKIA